MEGREKVSNWAILVVAVALVVAGGCGKRGNTFELSRLGFSMKLPQGWEQGVPMVGGGFAPNQTGEFFYADRKYEDPSGSVIEFPLEDISLTEYVDILTSGTEKIEKLQAGLMRTLGKMTGQEDSEELKEAESTLQTKVISKTPRTISGHEAIEVLTEAPRTILTVYVCREDDVIWVTFGAPKEEFPKYEQLFRDTIETIKIR